MGLLYWVHPLAVPSLLLVSITILVAAGQFPHLTSRQLLSLICVHAYVSVIAVPSVLLDPIQMWARIVAIPLLMIWCAALLQPRPDEVLHLIRLVGAGSVVACILMYIQSGPFDLNVTLAQLLTRNRADGYYLLGRFYQGAPAIAGPAGIGFVCSLIAILNGRLLGRVGYGLGALAALAILVLSVSRAALIAVALASVLLGVLAVSRRLTLARLVLLATCLGIASGAGILLYDLALENIPAAALRYQTMFGGPGQDASLGERFLVWTHYLDAALSKPFGHGFAYAQGSVAFMDMSAHNEVLGHWMGAGILGALMYVAILFRWGWVTALAVLMPARSSAGAAGAALLAFFAVVGMTENFSVSSGSLLFVIFWLLVGVMLFTTDADYPAHA